MLARAVAVAYGVLAYLAFLASFTALMLAATGLAPAVVAPVDGAPRLAWPGALAIDLGLLAGLGIQHSIMARAWWKNALGRVLPRRVERSTFVLASSTAVGAMALCWAPIGGDLWRAAGPAALALRGAALAGFALATAATFAFDHLELFGLRQVLSRSGPVLARFRVPPLYRVVRHPMMLGILVGAWATPRMTAGHLVLAAGLTAYVLLGLALEERDLLRTFGDRYAAYRAEVPMLLPWPRRRRPRDARVGAGAR